MKKFAILFFVSTSSGMDLIHVHYGDYYNENAAEKDASKIIMQFGLTFDQIKRATFNIYNYRNLSYKIDAPVESGM